VQEFVLCGCCDQGWRPQQNRNSRVFSPGRPNQRLAELTRISELFSTVLDLAPVPFESMRITQILTTLN
jgi:hypothetical protein